MYCINHQESRALSLCRMCSVPLCASCATKAESGFVCSESCKLKAATTDALLQRGAAALKANFRAKQIALSAVTIIFGFLILTSKMYSGKEPGFVAVLLGILLMIGGLAACIRIIYSKKLETT